jgi:hypothetical protein
MVRLAAVALLASLSLTSAFVPSIGRSATRSPGIRMAIDYNDPVVAEEFTKVQPMFFEDVEAELLQKGIRVPPTMKYGRACRMTCFDETSSCLTPSSFALSLIAVTWKRS